MKEKEIDPVKQVVELTGKPKRPYFFAAVMLSKQVLSTSADDLKDLTL